jgi:N-acetylmuramic acid 6-phosphate etherase
VNYVMIWGAHFCIFALTDIMQTMPAHPKGTARAEHRLTEQRNPDSWNLEHLSARQILRLMNREDRQVALAVAREIPAITRAVESIVRALLSGGRLIYVGAGSSGRLAVLDAAECPPTFGVSPKLVRALIAGGKRALTDAVEGAEDSPKNAVRDLQRVKLSRNDVVVGVAASGTTPYVLSALRYASRKRAATVAITSNRRMPIARHANIVIAPQVGPEIITGSTRLKAGTSQKMVLNMLSTASMVRLGHVHENLMIDLKLTNQKLKDRAVRILTQSSGKNVSAARRALRQSGYSPRTALIMLKKSVNASEARRKLAAAKGNLRKALGRL